MISHIPSAWHGWKGCKIPSFLSEEEPVARLCLLIRFLTATAAGLCHKRFVAGGSFPWHLRGRCALDGTGNPHHDGHYNRGAWIHVDLWKPRLVAVHLLPPSPVPCRFSTGMQTILQLIEIRR